MVIKFRACSKNFSFVQKRLFVSGFILKGVRLHDYSSIGQSQLTILITGAALSFQSVPILLADVVYFGVTKLAVRLNYHIPCCCVACIAALTARCDGDVGYANSGPHAIRPSVVVKCGLCGSDLSFTGFGGDLVEEILVISEFLGLEEAACALCQCCGCKRGE